MLIMNNIISIAKKTLAIEIAAINGLENFITDSFVKAVEAIHASQGRFVVSGIGKSSIIAQKIVATCNSTGTPSVFLHAAEAIHGDSGMIMGSDVVMIISKSGESPEIKNLVQLVKSFGNIIIGMVGNTESYLAKEANWIINTTVEKEACANNLAPTSSTTAQIVMGDLIAMSLMELKEFKAVDFAKFHPGGNLGKRLTLTAGQIATVNHKPTVFKSTSLKEVIVTISKNRLGATAVVDEKNNVEGIITDGDIRRMLEQHASIQGLTASDIYNSNPIAISPVALAVEALSLMEQKDISQIIVAEGQQYVGMIHIHDLMKEGIL
jgi:arabinose-5-phosphate isomerase